MASSTLPKKKRKIDDFFRSSDTTEKPDKKAKESSSGATTEPSLDVTVIEQEVIHSENAKEETTTVQGPKKRKCQQRWSNEYPWIDYDSGKNLMFCQLCRNANKDNLLACGTDNFRTSTITRHVAHPDHQLLLTAKSMNKSTEVAFQRSYDLESEAIVTAMKAVYFLAKEHLPLTKYTSIINLFKSVKAEHIEHLKGGESTYYDSSYASSEFLEAISDHFTEEVNKKTC